MKGLNLRKYFYIFSFLSLRQFQWLILINPLLRMAIIQGNLFLFILTLNSSTIINGILSSCFPGGSCISQSEKKVVPHKQLECLADFILLSKHPKTKIVAEKGYYLFKNVSGIFGIKEEMEKVHEDEWFIRRGIVHVGAMDQWEFDEGDLVKTLGEEKARKCLKRNGKLMRKEKGRKLSRRTFFNAKDLFEASDNGQLFISENYRQMIDKGMECVTNLLPIYYGFDAIEQFSIVNTSADIQNPRDIIHWEYKVKNPTKNVVLTWKWTRQNKEVLRENRVEFGEFLKCKKLLEFEEESQVVGMDQNRNRNNMNVVGGGGEINIHNLLEQHFIANQIFITNMPQVPHKQLECLANYILLAKYQKTEIFAEKGDYILVKRGQKEMVKKIREEEWFIRRGIAKIDDAMDQWEISRNDLMETLGKNDAKMCWKRNWKLLSKKEGQRIFSVKNLFLFSDNGHLFISENYRLILANSPQREHDQLMAIAQMVVNRRMAFNIARDGDPYGRMDETAYFVPQGTPAFQYRTVGK